MPKYDSDVKAFFSHLSKIDCQKDVSISCRFKCFILGYHGVGDPSDPLNHCYPHGEVQPTWA